MPPLSHRHALQVVGEDAQPDPGPGAGQAAQAGAAQPEAALEVADAGLDPDPPGAQPAERSGGLVGGPGGAGPALAVEPVVADAQVGDGVGVGGGPKSAVGGHGGRDPTGQAHDPSDGWGQ